MREMHVLPTLTAKNRRDPILTGIVLLLVWSGSAGCGVKKQTRVVVPQKILLARTATLDELLDIVNKYSRINDLSCNRLKLTLTLGKRESGILDKYKKASGYIVLKRPDSIRLTIQEPIIKTAQLDLVSVDDEFSMYIRSRNEFFVGKNSAEDLVAEELPDSPEIPIRPIHLFRAILPQSIDLNAPGVRILPEEDVDANAKYYALTVFREDPEHGSSIERRIWIERSALVLARQRLFGKEGQIVGDIVYSNMHLREGFYLPDEIYMDRPQDGYAFEMEFTGGRWKINSGLNDKAFILTPPEGTRIIHLREKGRSDAS